MRHRQSMMRHQIIFLFVQLLMLAVNGRKNDQQNLNAGLVKDLAVMKGEMASLQSQMNDQQEVIAKMNKKHDLEMRNIKQLVATFESSQSLQTEFSCLSEFITPWCFDGGVINITDAYYGVFNTKCPEGECCMPDQLEDCRVRVEDNRMSDWVGLKASCDNRTSCNYEYLGSVVDECATNQVADYLQVYYNCGEGSSTPQFKPAGFSAFIEHDAQYGEHTPIEFTGILSNIGNHYHANNSTFTCPRHGIYFFSLNIRPQFSAYVYLELMRDDDFIAEAMCDGQVYPHDQSATVVVVVECEAGQVVWVSSGNHLADVEGDMRNSVFSGYMLYPY